MVALTALGLETIGTVLLRRILGSHRAILVLLVGTTGSPIRTRGKIPSPRIKTTKRQRGGARPRLRLRSRQPRGGGEIPPPPRPPDPAPFPCRDPFPPPSPLPAPIPTTTTPEIPDGTVAIILIITIGREMILIRKTRKAPFLIGAAVAAVEPGTEME